MLFRSILESKLYGADAILLIAKILTRKQIEDLYQYANKLNLDVLIEIESIHEISKIRNIKNSLIGINNRNLKEQKINVDKSINLSNLIKNKNFIVSESGIDIKNIKKIKEETNIKTFLIGGSVLNSSEVLNYINKLYNS